MKTTNVTFRPIVLAMTVVLLALLALSCGGTGNPVAPQDSSPDLKTIENSDETGGHQLWGFWNCHIPADQSTIEFVPDRAGMFHLNARRFLEDTACTNCLQLLSVDKDFVNMVITAQIQLTHPFPGLDRYTGFDVRGVVISDGSLYFPTIDARLPDASLGDFTLLNPDGWTRMWNTIEFPPGSGPFKILEYSVGKHATPGSYTSTVNPYIEFTQDPRSCFPAGQSMTREFKLTLKPGEAFFGYAIDASWQPPLVDPPIDLMTDFPSSANAMEPYVLSVTQDSFLWDQPGDMAFVGVEMADRQIEGLPTDAQFECPGLWSGIVSPQIWGVGFDQPLWIWVTTSFDITNETGASEGSYPALLKVFDGLPDPYLGDINRRYELAHIEVKHYEPPDLKGKAVFIAPLPPDPNGMPGPPNVFLIDLETMEETQVTDYVGVGPMIEEPRINPQGTHVVVTFCPTPYDSHLEVFELGGSHWIPSLVGAYDGHADFHPDGERIIFAAGSSWDSTPDLMSMKYDGSERVKLAIAPGSIRYPRCSPDGSRVAMVINTNSTPPMSAIYMYDIAANEFTEILSGEYMIAAPSWSPSPPPGEELIAYESTENDPWGFWSDIYVINPNTLEKQMLFDTGMNERHPSWSPDGLSVMYSTDSMFVSELFVYQIPIEESAQITFDELPDDSPCWCWGW
jgi:hypothetical protein